MTKVLVAGLVLAAGAASALAGGAGENAILVIDPNDPVSVRLGHYYKNARQIPDQNVIYMSPGAADHAAFRAGNLAALAGHIDVAGLADHADYVLIAPTPTFFVSSAGMITDTCFPVTRFSISTAYTSALVTGDFVGGALQSLPNRYYSASNSAVAFDSNTTWLAGAASTQPTARRYYIGGLIGYTGVRGNTPEEIISMIDLGTGVEGTRPAGTIYLMNNTSDPARNVRASQFSGVRTTITTNLARPCEIVVGNMPINAQDCAGIMTGFSYATIADLATMRLLPGAFCDHLTSYAATFDSSDQTKCSEWIAKGASGTAGTVEEPCNYPGKFPHARLHVWYLQGATLGEAYLRSLQYVPFQNLLVGDALARPYAYVPSVSATGLPGGVASGTVELDVSATTAQPRATIAGFDLLIDGVVHGSVTPGGRFTIDTTLLDDGWHDVRVLGFDSTPNRTVGRWRGTLTTNNRGRTAGISAPLTAGDLTTRFPLVVSGGGLAVREIQVVQNGRVVASAGESGVVFVPGRSLGSGESNVHARVLFVDGREALSAPVVLTVSTAVGSGGTFVPEAASYTKNGQPGKALVVELPAAFADDRSLATFQVLSGPTKATVVGGAGAFRILNPNPGATGSDLMTYRVTTPAGSAEGRIVIRWGSACPADYNGDGFVDFFDYDGFVACFSGSCGPGESADFNDDGFVDFFDYDQYVEAFTAGC